MLEYGKMTRQELKECASLAAEAFSEYEYFSIYIPDDRRRKRFLHALIQCEFKANWENTNVVFLTAKDNNRIVAIAQLCTPGFKKPSGLYQGWLVWRDVQRRPQTGQRMERHGKEGIRAMP